MDIQFLKYIPTPGEKTVGIAVVRFERRFIFRFKIQARQEGGYWVQPPALKIGVQDGKDKYEGAFQFDSSYEADEIRAFVLEETCKAIKASDSQNIGTSQASVFSSAAPRPDWMPAQNQNDLPF